MSFDILNQNLDFHRTAEGPGNRIAGLVSDLGDYFRDVNLLAEFEGRRIDIGFLGKVCVYHIDGCAVFLYVETKEDWTSSRRRVDVGITLQDSDGGKGLMERVDQLYDHRGFTVSD